MTKTPEEYFQDQEFQPEPEASEETFTEAEKAFLEKYLGLEEPGILEKLGIDAPVETKSVPVPEAPREPTEAFRAAVHEPGPEPETALEEALDEAPEIQEAAESADEEKTDQEEQAPDDAVEEVLDEVVAAAPEQAATPEFEKEQAEEEDWAGDEALEALVEETPEDRAIDEARSQEALAHLAQEQERDLEDRLKEQEQLQLVSFYVGHQEYTLPIQAVQEVVRAVKPSKVPEAPDYMAGLVNLRGRVTPLIRPDVLLGVERGQTAGEEKDDGEDHFIIVCSQRGLQVGLLVRKVATMYYVQQDNIEWNIDTRLGGAVELVTALMRRHDDTLVGIVSIDRIVERLLKR